jgi:hypothetical protein
VVGFDNHIVSMLLLLLLLLLLIVSLMRGEGEAAQGSYRFSFNTAVVARAIAVRRGGGSGGQVDLI